MLWLKDKNLKPIKELKGIKLISCDIFDTLLMRTTVDPEDIFTHVAKSAINKGAMSAHISPEEFKHIRIHADMMARRTLGTEVNFEEIYYHIPEHIGSKNELMKIEFEVERMHTYVNRNVASLLEFFFKKNVPIVLLSDMYLSSAQLEELLRHAGFDVSILNKIMVSNEYRATKFGHGDLYPLLLENFAGTNPENIIHIGDNFKSDVVNSQKYGINAVYYSGKEDKNSLFEIERFKKEQIIPELFSLRKLAGSLSADFEESDRFWYEFGASVLGPVITLGIEWIIDTAEKEGIKNIYPFMRGGEFSKILISNSLSYRGVTDIKVSPIYTSRRATYLPTLPKITKGTVSNSILSSPWLTIGALFRRLKVENPFVEYADVTLGQAEYIMVKEEEKLKNKVEHYLCQKDILDQIEKKRMEDELLLYDYLIQNFDINEKYITYDIGHAGTIQMALSRFLQSKGHKDNGLHLVVMGSEMTLEKIMNGLKVRGFICNAGVNSDCYKSINWMPGIIDELISENIGSTIGYQKYNFATVPIIDDDSIFSLNSKQKDFCQKGILSFQRLLHELITKKRWVYEEIFSQRQKLSWILTRFMEYPTYDEATHLGELQHENFYDEGNGYTTFCPSPLEEKVRQSGPDYFSKHSRNSLLIWPAGLVERAFPNYSKLFIRKQSGLSDASAVMAQVADKLYRSRITDLAIYGAGQMGRELLKIIGGSLKIHCFIDRNEKLWGTDIEGIPVLSIEKASSLKVKTIAIASIAYLEEICHTISGFFRDNNDVNIIYYSN